MCRACRGSSRARCFFLTTKEPPHMRSHLLHGGLGLLCLALASWEVPAAAPPGAPGNGRLARLDDIAVLARKIDQHVAAGLKEKKAVAAPLASDHEFVRRVYLDLAGRIPRVSEVRAFVSDKRADKRR